MRSTTWEPQESVSVPSSPPCSVREQKHYERKVVSSAYNRVIFTKEMKKDYTLLCPQMSPIHFELIEPAIRAFGYKLEVLQNDDKTCRGYGPEVCQQ